MRHFRHFWKQKYRRSSRPKSIFGGDIKSQEEIKKLNDHINETEQKELEEFESNFDDLWDSTQKNNS